MNAVDEQSSEDNVVSPTIQVVAGVATSLVTRVEIVQIPTDGR